MRLSPRSTLARASLLVPALALTAGLTAGVPTGLAPASAATTATSATTASADASGITLDSGQPERVLADGTVPFGATNDTGRAVQLTTTVSVTTRTGSTSGPTSTVTVPAHGRVGSLGSVGSAGLTRLVAASFGHVTLHVTGTGVDVTRRLFVVAPSYAPRLAANPTNPLAGVVWADYRGTLEPSWTPFVRATGATQEALAKIALTPKAQWFTGARGPAGIEKVVAKYVREAQAIDPDGLVQLTMFVIDPWETAACDAAPTAAQLTRDRQNIAAFARGIGSARAMVVIQPDGPFAGCRNDRRKRLSKTVAYAARTLSALPKTAAYVDMGSADYDKGPKSVQLLIDGGIKYARGISLDVTHADSVAHQITFAQHLVSALAKRGIKGKHVVIDTSDNAQPFASPEWNKHHRKGLTSITQADACTSKHGRLCLSLGIPPTTDVANPRWGLSTKLRGQAARLVDAYIWVKRPWLTPVHGYPFSVRRGIDVANSSKYWSPS